MGRSPRIQQPGAIYHVTAQANRSEALFLDSEDRRMFFLFVCRTVDHHDWHVHAWCVLTTHYRLLITTPRGDLAAGMHRLQSRYAHWFNYEHAELGHVFRRRYGARHVQTDERLRWCCRYRSEPRRDRSLRAPRAVEVELTRLVVRPAGDGAAIGRATPVQPLRRG